MKLKLSLSLSRIKRVLGPIVGSSDRKSGIIADLLSQANPRADLYDRMYWLENILTWLDAGGENSSTVRVRYLFQLLDQNPAWKSNVAATLCSLLRDCPFLRLFMQTGFAVENGLWTELIDRIMLRLLPSPPVGDFLEIIDASIAKEDSAEKIRLLPPEALNNFAKLLAQDNDWFTNIQKGAREALLIFATNVGHYGLSSDVRLRHDLAPIEKSPFVEIQKLIHRFLSQVGEQAEIRDQLDPVLGLCRQAIDAVYKNMESHGVSVALVYRLEILSVSLQRIDDLIAFLAPGGQTADDFAHQCQLLFAKLVQASYERRSVRDHLRERLYLLSRKIAERNGYSGEHYFSRTRSELRQLFLSGMGGGVIVVLMTIGKILVHDLGLPPLLYAFCAWIVYAIGFLAMQFTGATLATKLPSFMASHLASKLKNIRERHEISEFATELRASMRSQAVAFLGNVAALVPLAFLISIGLKHVLGAPLLNLHEAAETLDQLNPFFSLAIPLGALTGLELWLSSLAGGWFENWMVFRRVPMSVSLNPRLRAVIGKKAADKFGERLLHHSSGFAANIALGFLFGFVPFLGVSLGLNLESKHVTISSTSAVIGFAAMDPAHFTWWLLASTMIGLALIGTMNFVVSFSFALFIAARASNVKQVFLFHALKQATRGANES